MESIAVASGMALPQALAGRVACRGACGVDGVAWPSDRQIRTSSPQGHSPMLRDRSFGDLGCQLEEKGMQNDKYEMRSRAKEEARAKEGGACS